MKTTKWSEIKRKTFTATKLREMERAVDEEILEMNLAALRRKLGLTQAELAEAVDVSQGELSRVERRADHLVSTIRGYVQGLGGELEVTAVVGDQRVRLHV